MDGAVSGTGEGVGMEEVVEWTDTHAQCKNRLRLEDALERWGGSLKSKWHQGKAGHPKERWK